MRRTPALLLALLVALVALAACGDADDGEVSGAEPGASQPGDEPGATEPAGDPLDGRTFATTTPSGLVEGTRLELAFADGQVRVHAGCNQMSGGYTLEGDTLVVDALAGTEMGCEPELMDQDARIQELFAQPVPWSLDGGILTIGAETGSFTLHDEEASAPAQELAGPTWVLDTIVDGESASSVPAGVSASITFAADGTYQLSAGCNSGGGTYVEAGAGIYQVDAPRLTRRRCDDAAMDVEAAVAGVLDGEVTMSIVGARLTVEAADAGLGFVAG